MRIVVWGTGHIANEYVQRKSYHLNDEIIAFVDNNRDMWGKSFADLKVISPLKLKDIEFDMLLICTKDYCDEIKNQIRNDLDIGDKRVATYDELEDDIKRKLILKYSDSPDMCIQNVIEDYKHHPLNIYGYYYGKSEKSIYPVKYETDGMPYILFEGKKMFFPRGYKFTKIDQIECVMDVLFEQGEHSPHLYIKSENVLVDDMVIVDAGVCEGNFALRYIDKAKKMYLIESDSKWIEALKRTFTPYEDKVVICDKYLSGEDTDTTITLDTLVKENINILKMDIEGYEVEALKGGRKVLTESSAYCSICSYHKHGDEQQIKDVLQDYGYNVSSSEGYMFFPYDSYIEFRKGVVYGEKYNDGE